MRPVAFIGSSGLNYKIVEAIAGKLSRKIDPHPWKTAFPIGKITLQALVEEAKRVDFGIFVFGSDDQLEADVSVPRDNVVYEAGLFAGVLGTDRSLIVHDEKVKMPSDLEGMTVARFNASLSIEEISDAVCPALLKAILEGGVKRFETVVDTIEGEWWQFSMAPNGSIERATCSLLRFSKTASGYLKFEGDAWAENGDRLAHFVSDLSVVNESNRSFIYEWTGAWFVGRKEIDGDDPNAFYGNGEFKVTSSNPDRARGNFTTRNHSNPDIEAQTPVIYRRAIPQDTLDMDGSDLKARRKLIQDRLAECLAAS